MQMENYQSYGVAITKYYRSGGLNNLKFIGYKSKFASRLVARSLFLAGRQPPFHSVLTWPFFFIHEGRQRSPVFLPLIIRTPVLLDKVPTLMTSFNFIFLKALSPNKVTLGLRLQLMKFGRTKFSPQQSDKNCKAFLKAMLHEVKVNILT